MSDCAHCKLRPRLVGQSYCSECRNRISRESSFKRKHPRPNDYTWSRGDRKAKSRA